MKAKEYKRIIEFLEKSKQFAEQHPVTLNKFLRILYDIKKLVDELVEKE